MKINMPPPELMMLLDGARLNAALVAALELRIFEHLSRGPATVDELAKHTAISSRGAQVIADALVALRIVECAGGAYKNTPVGDAFFVPGRPGYVGDEQVGMYYAQLPTWSRLTELVRSGEPAHENDSPEMLKFWELLTPVIARRGRPIAEEAMAKLGFSGGESHLLDVGGGASALYALALLRANPRARATQLDWPHINRAAMETVRAAGHAERFSLLDGDFHKVDCGSARFDVAVLSNIMHQESPDSNRALLEKLRAALKPGGRLVVSEFVVDDGRTGPPSSLLFNLAMLAHSRGGKSYTRGELRALIEAARFTTPTFTPVGPFSTLIVAEAR